MWRATPYASTKDLTTGPTWDGFSHRYGNAAGQFTSPSVGCAARAACASARTRATVATFIVFVAAARSSSRWPPVYTGARGCHRWMSSTWAIVAVAVLLPLVFRVFWLWMHAETDKAILHWRTLRRNHNKGRPVVAPE